MTMSVLVTGNFAAQLQTCNKLYVHLVSCCLVVFHFVCLECSLLYNQLKHDAMFVARQPSRGNKHVTDS